MADVFSRAKRSEIMARIKGKSTKPELRLKKLLRAAGIRYRSHPNLPGTPDVILPDLKTAVFVHGCFWHGHKECHRSHLPAIHRTYWTKKIEANTRRDKKSISELHQRGWKVKIIWQCKLPISSSTWR